MIHSSKIQGWNQQFVMENLDNVQHAQLYTDAKVHYCNLAGHFGPMTNDGRLFCLECMCWSKTRCIIACIFRIAGLHFTTLPVAVSLR